MKITKYNFESQCLVVDWISWKFPSFEEPTQKNLAKYLLGLGFDSYQIYDDVEEVIYRKSGNTSVVRFVPLLYSRAISVAFTGPNAALFYRCVKENLIDWSFFASSSLSRFDINYSRRNKVEDPVSVLDFFDRCQTKLKQKNYKCSKNSRGRIFTIGNRKSNRYSRIYESGDFLKFEHEMKGRFIADYKSLLVNNLEEFEQKLTDQFLFYFAKSLPLEFCYTDWLLLLVRPTLRPETSALVFNGEYIDQTTPKSLEQRRQLITLLHLFRYAKALSYEPAFFVDTPYRTVTFKLKDFLDFQTSGTQPANPYQLKKLAMILTDLQKSLVITSFSKNSFKSIMGIPRVHIYKENDLNAPWVAQVSLAEEVFNYTFPFMLPNLFSKKLSKDEFEVQFHIFQVYTSVAIAKEFRIQEFLDNYASKISHSRISKIKQFFIQSVQTLDKLKLIEGQYKDLNDQQFYSIDKLNSRTLGKGFIIYEKLSFESLE